MKRMLDLVVCITLLFFLLPVILIIACTVRWKLGSPVFFVQKRPGFKEVPFRLYKFRTMNDARDRDGMLLDYKMRITRLGAFLRKYSLDELPQLFNVLKGELSLVGPRPLLMKYLPLYNERQAKRHHVKPGITGWAQINGRNAITWDEKFELDVWYVENRNIWLDVTILWRTLLKVMKSENINLEEPDFVGSSKVDKQIHG